jgi:hypothetical protein
MAVKLLFFDSYIDTIKNSVGSKIFQTLWAELDGKKKDITNKGNLSCAVFVSAILLWFGLIKEKHATVDSTIKDMKEFKWKRIKKPRIGSILVWEDLEFDDGPHSHLGFYIGENQAISNSLKLKTPAKHHWTYGTKNKQPKRKVIAIYWHPRLNDKYF